jgi:hypothetical protein
MSRHGFFGVRLPFGRWLCCIAGTVVTFAVAVGFGEVRTTYVGVAEADAWAGAPGARVRGRVRAASTDDRRT